MVPALMAGTAIGSELLEFFDEQLSIYQFQNNLALLDFEYTFSKEDAGGVRDSDTLSSSFSGLFP